MSLLDDAIKQHLELKRKHGASDDELRELEDQAFGAAERPGADAEAQDSGDVFDESSEAPTQFLGEAVGGEAAPLGADTESGETAFTEPVPSTEESEAEPPAGEIAPEPSVQPVSADSGDDPFEVPPYRVEEDDDEPSAMEHEIAPPADETSEEPPGAETDQAPPAALSSEEREEIAAQPTQLYDFESDAGEEPPAEVAADLPPADPEPPAAPPPGPPPADLSALEDSNFEEETGEETFFDEQSLSDELDQALDVPAGSGAAPAVEPAADEVEDDDPGEAASHPAPPPGQSEDAGEAEDLLEETPDFLQDTPENERLWFEQKPPKDFDFDD